MVILKLMRKRSKTILTLLMAAILVFLLVKFISPDFWPKAIAAAGMADFFQQTLPRYLREKLSIPQNPVAKRQQLLDQLSSAIGNIERELEVVSPVVTNGASAPAPKLPSPQTIQEQIEKTRDFLAQSETVLEELQKANPGQGILEKITERLLDKILPPIGGDAGGGIAGSGVSVGGASAGGSSASGGGGGSGSSGCQCP